jgi:cell division protein FtsW (lipid II flippase)
MIDIESQEHIKKNNYYIIFKELCYMIIGTIMIFIFFNLIGYQDIKWNDVILYFYSWICYIILTVCRIISTTYIYTHIHK